MSGEASTFVCKCEWGYDRLRRMRDPQCVEVQTAVGVVGFARCSMVTDTSVVR